MQLFVRLDGASGGRSVVIDANRSDTWENVKLQVRSTGGLQGVTNEQLYFASSSRVLDDLSLVADSEVTDGSNVQCCVRMAGGGGDGGSTGAESREAYLEMYKQKTAGALDPREERLAAYQRCKLSGDQLRPPIVADELGMLFSKEAVLKALVNKSMPAYLSHISGMKHVVELKLERNPNFGAEGSSVVKQGAAASGPTNEAEFQCPITGLQFNSKFKFLAHERSGHVFSEKALKEAKPVVEEAMGAPVKAYEWIILCGNEHDREKMQARMLERRAAIKSKKKGKKSGKRAAGADLEAGVAKGRQGAKKAKDTAELAPEWADHKLWKSLFTSSKPTVESGQATETFLCRSTMARGMNLT